MNDIMRREMRVSRVSSPDDLPGSLPDAIYDEDGFSLSREGFAFTTKGGVRFLYRRGHAIRAGLPGEGARDEFRLYLWGTVFGAVAWLNGLVPIHASAIAIGGRIVAFTAESGGGKSTLAAALANAGFAHVCDDTLVLALEGDRVMAMPDGKPMKLWEDAIALTGAAPEAPVGVVAGKHYARPAHAIARALPLTDLVVLDAGGDIALAPVTGAARLGILRDALYRGFIHAALGDPARHARLMTGIAAKVRCWRLSRPVPAADFAAQTGEIATLLRALA